jgi:hypothetical protein
MKHGGCFRRAIAVLALVHAASAVAAEGIINVRDEGAVADGKAVCTSALQRAIDRCRAAGGGTVYFPAGTYLSGTLELKSHVTLHLDTGAILRGSPNPQDYPARPSVAPSYTDRYVRQALIAGENLEHVRLHGGGTIEGGGEAFRWKEYRDRPYVIRLVQCRDVTVDGLTLRASPMWMQHYLACDRVRIHGVRVFNHASYNNDGLDIDACHDVTVSDCTIDSDDDAIVLKSTLDRACENVTITNCVLSSHANAFKLGTESNGGFRNIAFNNSVIVSPRFSESMYGMQRGLAGIALECVDGGKLENVVIANVTITGVNVALFLRLGDRGRHFLPDGPKLPVGTFRKVSLSNIVATGTGRIGCSITGLPDHLIENVTLSDISLEFEGGGRKQLADKAVPERPEAYPESRMFGELPAYGVYCRHVRGLRFDNVRLSTMAPDARHALVCDDVRDLDINGLNAATAPIHSAAVLRFSQVQDARVRGFAARGMVDVFLKVDGEATRYVALIGNDFVPVRRVFESAAGVRGDAIRESGNLSAR